jgi:hypothetical protein
VQCRRLGSRFAEAAGEYGEAARSCWPCRGVIHLCVVAPHTAPTGLSAAGCLLRALRENHPFRDRTVVGSPLESQGFRRSDAMMVLKPPLFSWAGKLSPTARPRAQTRLQRRASRQAKSKGAFPTGVDAGFSRRCAPPPAARQSVPARRGLHGFCEAVAHGPGKKTGG